MSKLVGLARIKSIGLGRRLDLLRRGHSSGAVISKCLKKKRYSGYELADQVRKSIFEERRVPLKIYFCSICHGYHLTSRIDNE